MFKTYDYHHSQGPSILRCCYGCSGNSDNSDERNPLEIPSSSYGTDERSLTDDIVSIKDQLTSPSQEEVLIDEEKKKLLAEPSGGKELTDIRSLEVAFRLSKKLDIRNLGLHLGIESYKLDAIFQDNKANINEAAHEVLQEWRKRQRSDTEAYKSLLAVLKHPNVNLLHIVRDVFGESVGRKYIMLEHFAINGKTFCNFNMICVPFGIFGKDSIGY